MGIVSTSATFADDVYETLFVPDIDLPPRVVPPSKLEPECLTWEKMSREFYRVMGTDGPSHTTFFRYAGGKVKRPNILTERYVQEAIRKITVELVEREQSKTLGKRVEKEVRETEERFRNLVEHTNDILWELDKGGAYTYISPNVLDILEYSTEQLIGKTPFEFMPEKEAERVRQIFGKVVHKRKLFTSLQHKALCKNGKVILLECSGRPIVNREGTFQGYRGIDRDITKGGEK